MTNDRLDGAWEARIDSVGAGAGYPPSPDLGPSVMAALREERVASRLPTGGASRLPTGGAPRLPMGWAPRLAIAAVLAIVLLAGTIAIPSARTAVGEFFGLVEGERIEVLPTPLPGVTPTELPTPAPLESFGTPFTLEEVAAVVGFEPALPNGEPPNAVFLVDFDGVSVAVLQYDDYDLWQTRETDYGYFGKGVPVTNVIETPQVGGSFGYWISGGSYVVRFINADGEEVIGSERTIDRSTLIWHGQQSQVFYRLETSLDLEAALAIGASLP